MLQKVTFKHEVAHKVPTHLNIHNLFGSRGIILQLVILLRLRYSGMYLITHLDQSKKSYQLGQILSLTKSSNEDTMSSHKRIKIF